MRNLGYQRALSLLGIALLILHPQLFGYNFYNPKDIPFLGVWVLALFGLGLVLILWRSIVKKQTAMPYPYRQVFSIIAISFTLLVLFLGRALKKVSRVVLFSISKDHPKYNSINIETSAGPGKFLVKRKIIE